MPKMEEAFCVKAPVQIRKHIPGKNKAILVTSVV